MIYFTHRSLTSGNSFQTLTSSIVVLRCLRGSFFSDAVAANVTSAFILWSVKDLNQNLFCTFSVSGAEECHGSVVTCAPSCVTSSQDFSLNSNNNVDAVCSDTTICNANTSSNTNTTTENPGRDDINGSQVLAVSIHSSHSETPSGRSLCPQLPGYFTPTPADTTRSSRLGPHLTHTDGSHNVGAVNPRFHGYKNDPRISHGVFSEDNYYSLSWEVSESSLSENDAQLFVQRGWLRDTCGSIHDFSKADFEADIRILKSLLETNSGISKDYQNHREIESVENENSRNCCHEASSLSCNTSQVRHAQKSEGRAQCPCPPLPPTEAQNTRSLSSHHTVSAGVLSPAGSTPDSRARERASVQDCVSAANLRASAGPVGVLRPAGSTPDSRARERGSVQDCVSAANLRASAGPVGVLRPAGSTPDSRARERASVQDCVSAANLRTSAGHADQVSRSANISDIRWLPGLTGPPDERGADFGTIAGDLSFFDHKRNNSGHTNTALAPPLSLLRSGPLLQPRSFFSLLVEKCPSFVSETLSRVPGDIDHIQIHKSDFDLDSCERFSGEKCSSNREDKNCEVGVTRGNSTSTASTDNNNPPIVSDNSSFFSSHNFPGKRSSKGELNPQNESVGGANSTGCSQIRTRKLVIRQTKASLLRQHIRDNSTTNQVLYNTCNTFRCTLERQSGNSGNSELSRDERVIKPRKPRKDTTFSGLPLTSKFGQRQSATKSNMAGRGGGATLVKSPALAKKMSADRGGLVQKREVNGAEQDKRTESQRARQSVPTLNFMRETQCRLSKIKNPSAPSSGLEDVGSLKAKTGEAKPPIKLSKLTDRVDGPKRQTLSATKKAERALHTNQDDVCVTKASPLSPISRRASRKENICSELSGHAQSPRSSRRNVKVLGVTSPPEVLSPITSPTDCPTMDEFLQGEILQTKYTQAVILPSKTDISSSVGNKGSHELDNILSQNKDSKCVSRQVETTETSSVPSSKYISGKIRLLTLRIVKFR